MKQKQLPPLYTPFTTVFQFNAVWHTQSTVALVLEASRKQCNSHAISDTYGLIMLVIQSCGTSSFLFYSIGLSYQQK
jgi:hypothetical protein